MATSDQIQGEMELGYQHTLVSYIARLDYNILGTLCAPALFCSNEHESGYFLIALYVNERCSLLFYQQVALGSCFFFKASFLGNVILLS